MATRDRPRTLPLSHRRSFVARHTRLRPVDGVPGLRLHLADREDSQSMAVLELECRMLRPQFLPQSEDAEAGLMLGDVVEEDDAAVSHGVPP